MTPADAQQLAAVTMTMVAVSFILGIGFYVWYSVMLAKVFSQAGLTPWSAWVPVYSQMQVFRLGGQNPWLALLLYVPIVQVAGLVFQVMALHRISGQYWRGVGTTVLGVLLPPVWATVLATGPSPDPERGRMPVRGASTGAIPPVAPGGPLAASVAAVAAGWPAPAAPGAHAAPAIVPAPRIQPATPVSPVSHAAPAPTAAAAPSVPPVAPAIERVPRIPGRIEPLPVMPATSASQLNAERVAPAVAPAATSGLPAWAAPAAGPGLPTLPPFAQPVPTDPFAVAEETALAAPKTPAEPQAFAEPHTAGTVVSGEDDLEDDLLDRTIVVARKPIVTWRLVAEGGEPLRLAGSVVLLGRNPRAANAEAGEQRLVVPDPSRTLSKTHAVLSLHGEQWSITDLDSTNGVLVPDWEGIDRLLDPGVPTPVPDRFVLGTLSVRIERDPPATGIPSR
ncbi:DUF5684 domain-containing protein [Agromyces sp. Leaf222]|uniref:DUF5684 domain-containing protein n=1 Tax=Agromyces sp. Leaf222 TaxID=1735688 RepID=UPI0006FC4AC1|nr:DUF5684 domain-containing protein [Agromyces sp. Leaf222]KQM82143.1 hypothetical protein ASE68_01550 [Agromyces sp. Leaf222]